tara:strand:+ start:14644 stop:14811 length:168 start_codon:yes stop_codon:yes gene_type:complete
MFKIAFLKSENLNYVGGAGVLLWISKESLLTSSLAPFLIRRDMAYYYHGIKNSSQ